MLKTHLCGYRNASNNKKNKKKQKKTKNQATVPPSERKFHGSITLLETSGWSQAAFSASVLDNVYQRCMSRLRSIGLQSLSLYTCDGGSTPPFPDMAAMDDVNTTRWDKFGWPRKQEHPTQPKGRMVEILP
jgi:hypothetical protein